MSGKYAVPEEIRALKPKGTMVKAIHGGYYVYEYRSAVIDGRRKTKMGPLVGAIRPGVGFVPSGGSVRVDETTVLEFGQYAIAKANSGAVLERLKRYFRADDAVRIYTVALIHFVNGFSYMKSVQGYYEMSVLSLAYPGMKLGYKTLSSLYDDLGRRQERVVRFEQGLADECSGYVAIDGHVESCCSLQNDLARKGYKFMKLGECQMNQLMAYDAETGTPLFARIYEGGCTDKVSVRDLLSTVLFRNAVFLIDCGFYSDENLRLFSKNGNAYIIPLPQNTDKCKAAVADLHMGDRFVYSKGRRMSVVEFRDLAVGDRRVLVFRDLSEAAEEQANYMRHMQMGDGNYSRDRFEALKGFMGVMVLQTNSSLSAERIFNLYKKRWSIETFFNYFKNAFGFESLYQQDYYQIQGLSFISLVSSLIRHEVERSVEKVRAMNMNDCLMQGRLLKACKRHGTWVVCNCRPKLEALFKALNTPLNANL